jgi:hypothetical protein
MTCVAYSAFSRHILQMGVFVNPNLKRIISGDSTLLVVLTHVEANLCLILAHFSFYWQREFVCHFASLSPLKAAQCFLWSLCSL